MTPQAKKDLNKIIDDMYKIGTKGAAKHVIDGYSTSPRMMQLLDLEENVLSESQLFTATANDDDEVANTSSESDSDNNNNDGEQDNAKSDEDRTETEDSEDDN